MNVYIHIPFCRSKCAYCAFLSVSDLSLQEKYLKSLAREIQARLKDIDKPVTTIYFGGGTPSMVEVSHLGEVLAQIADLESRKEIEITLETNPEDITLQKLEAWKALGINRLSIGVQSLDDTVRKIIGRRLSAEEVLGRIVLAQKTFERVGADLIAGLPGEKIDGFLGGIDKLADLGLTHLSLYDLEISEGSFLARNLNKFVMQNDLSREQFLTKSWALLDKLGFEQYEISNFAKGYDYSRHNLAFWQGKDYWGFGLGAVSKIGKVIETNTSDFSHYFEGKRLKITEVLVKKDDHVLKISRQIRLAKPIKELFVGKSDSLERVKALGFVDDNFLVTKKGKLFNDCLLNELL